MGDRAVRLFAPFGLFPIPAEQKPGRYTLEILDGKGAALRSTPITVRDAHYPAQNVVLAKEITELKPSPGEVDTTKAFRETVSATRYWTEPLDAPVSGCMTSLFGVRRFQNGKPSGSSHGGVDLRGAAGLPVHAAAAGVVRIARQYNLHGGTVGIDHGQGFESMYLHLSKFAVAEGAMVKRGDVIGYIGSTGRSTAPHLHWTLYVYGVPVNPAQWVTLQACPSRKLKK
jgi:murein DD-endopeptidase MepM/ murein hydrolase activator NlpD